VGRKTCFGCPPAPEEWRRLFDEAGRQAMTGVLFRAVEALPEEQLPPKDIILKWYAARERIARRNRLMNRQAALLMQRMEHDGIRPCLLKGQGVATLYDEPLYRVPGDIDLWPGVTKRQTIEYARKHCRGKCGAVCPHHIGFPVIGDTPVELHFYPATLMNPLLDRRLQAFFRRKEKDVFRHRTSLSGHAVVTPTASFNAVFLLVHTFKHFIGGGVGLRQVMDYYYLLVRGLTENEKAETVRMLGRLHLKKFASAVMYVLRVVFGLEKGKFIVEENAAEGEVLLRSIMDGGNFGRYSARSARAADRHGSHLMRYIRGIPHSLRLLRNYPVEVMFAPLHSIYFFLHLRWYRIICKPPLNSSER